MGAQKTPVWLVGGAPRDWALEKSAPDFDLVAPRGESLPLGERLAAELGGRFVLLHEDFGACRIVLADGGWLDLTDLQGASIEEDLRRRDLTINALALPWPAADSLLDPTGGLADLADKIARRPSPGCLLADPVRVLRVYRFAAELDLRIEAPTEDEIHAAVSRLPDMPGERVWEELRRILAVESAAPWIERLAQTRILDALLPPLAASAGCAQPSFHHLDVRDHCLEAAKQSDALIADRLYAPALADPDNRALLRLAALLHDAGKPATAAPNHDGDLRFHGHTAKSAELAAAVADRLRLSNQLRRRLTRLVDAHMRPHQLAELLAQNRLTPRSVHKFFKDLQGDWLLCLSLSRADLRATAGPDAPRDGDRQAQLLAEHFTRIAAERRSAAGDAALLRGEDILALGVAPGPRIGEILEAISQARFENPRLTRPEALALAAKLAAGESLSSGQEEP
ncbi:MAG: CCA tRNA nucleotidyltransferase [Myxococcales bacterium]|nr:CCA tRNA nucleotidyltransferase [Myxococcales bacterium]